jgi:hypothetical protein
MQEMESRVEMNGRPIWVEAEQGRSVLGSKILALPESEDAVEATEKLEFYKIQENLMLVSDKDGKKR